MQRQTRRNGGATFGFGWLLFCLLGSRAALERAWKARGDEGEESSRGEEWRERPLNLIFSDTQADNSDVQSETDADWKGMIEVAAVQEAGDDAAN